MSPSTEVLKHGINDQNDQSDVGSRHVVRACFSCRHHSFSVVHPRCSNTSNQQHQSCSVSLCTFTHSPSLREADVSSFRARRLVDIRQVLSFVCVIDLLSRLARAAAGLMSRIIESTSIHILVAHVQPLNRLKRIADREGRAYGIVKA
jgi:hypothetical protein